MSHFVEVSYSDDQGARGMDPALIDLAGKYYGGASGRGVTGDRRRLEFLFPHFEQASGIHRRCPGVSPPGEHRPGILTGMPNQDIYLTIWTA